MSYECPADGCNYTGMKRSVAAHYSGSQDDAHSGGYERAMILLEDTETDTDGAQTDSETTETDGGDDPLFGSGGSQTDREPDRNNDPDELQCPECGGEVVDFTAYESGQYHEVNGQNVFVRGDYVCSSCHGWFVNE